MYDELVKRLKNCATQAAPCLTCDMTDDGSCIETLMKQAADAIEELTGFVQEAERDRDEYRERLDKANDAIEDLEFACNHYEKDYKDLCAYLPKWIPVTERLPEDLTRVIVFCEDGVSFGLCEHLIADDEEVVEWHDFLHYPITPTHWMPLPQPPKEE